MAPELDLITRDLKHIWHPCSQMKDFEKYPPIIVQSAKGSYLHTPEGPIIDAISSWWCKSLGHGHPAVTSAISDQLNSFEHVIGANTTHPRLVELGEQLADISGKQHVFFASDGSSAVEIAIKLAMHATNLKGQHKRNQFVALKNSYHGETIATLSVSDLGLYKKPYGNFGVPCHFLQHVPYVLSVNDPLWSDASIAWTNTLRELEAIKDEICAILVEPIVQGASGMLCYSADYLRRLAQWAHENDIYFIADEIMTGLGRTGKWLACQHAGVDASLICLSKGLTSGSIPLSCVLIDHSIYELFYQDADTHQSFLHSHTYSGNALAVSAALATITSMRSEGTNQQAAELGEYMRDCFTNVAAISQKITRVRSFGAIVAGDLEDIPNQRIGYQLAKAALKRGALLRPIGNTLYWLPPLNTNKQTIEQLSEITLHSIKAVY